MSWATAHIEKLKAGETVTFRPKGRSMEPIIMSGQEVTVEPVTNGEGLAIEDVVLCKVKGSEYLHRIIGYDESRGTFQIGNNKGRINGWVTSQQIFGKRVP